MLSEQSSVMRRLTSFKSNTDYCVKDGKFLFLLSYIHFN